MREPPPHLTDEDVLATVNEHWDGGRGPDRAPAGRVRRAPLAGERRGHDPVRHVRPPRRSAHAPIRSRRRTPERGRWPSPASTSSWPRSRPDGTAHRAVRGRRAQRDAVADGKSGDGSMSPARARETASDARPPARHPARRTTSPAGGRSSTKASPTTWPRARPAPGTPARTATTPATAIRERLDDIATWTATYHRLATTADAGHLGPDPRRAAHPQPAGHRRRRRCSSTGSRSSWRPASATCAASRTPATRSPAPNARMLELFDLEWRLDEITQYATWFEAWHTGTGSDAVAFAGPGRRARRVRGATPATDPLRSSLRNGPWTPSGSRENAAEGAR